METLDFFNIAMRWVHISSMTIIVGGMLCIWLGLEDTTRYRPFYLAASVLVILSGLYNFLNKTNLTPTYHAIFGIKILLVLHVLAAGFLATKSANPKRRRQAAGAAITGFLILALSAFLRKLST